MRIVFLGSGAFGLPTLERLAAAHDLVALVTQPDRPAGRKRAPTPTPVGIWASEALRAHAPDAPLIKPENVNEPETLERLRSIEADAWVVIAFGQKLGRALLADRLAMNLHASRLPRWRGAAPINHAILAGDTRTGNSVITLAERMDAGDVLAQSTIKIDSLETAGELHDRLASDGPDLIEGVLSAAASGALRPHEQDESQATPAPKLSRADAWVDFADRADVCRRRIHGLTPWPGVTVSFEGSPLKLLRASVGEGLEAGGLASEREEPGAILDPEQGLVRCADATLRLLEVQPAGKRPMTWREFAAGRRIRPGAALLGGRPG